jgi:hypothetical protein
MKIARRMPVSASLVCRAVVENRSLRSFPYGASLTANGFDVVIAHSVRGNRRKAKNGHHRTLSTGASSAQ